MEGVMVTGLIAKEQGFLQSPGNFIVRQVGLFNQKSAKT
jgi:hypothetical protein